MAHIRQNRGFGVAPVAAVIFLVAALAGYLFIEPTGRKAPDALSGDGGAFEVVDAAQRELDGSPALALSFSLPLDPRSDYDSFLQVVEVPSSQKQQKARVSDDDEEAGDEEYAPDSAAKLGTGVSRAPEDTKTDGGKPVSGA